LSAADAEPEVAAVAAAEVLEAPPAVEEAPAIQEEPAAEDNSHDRHSGEGIVS
jgi:hypothetical protein